MLRVSTQVYFLFLTILLGLPSHADFIADDIPDAQDQPFPLSNHTDEMDADLERLRAIAQSIESRARRFGLGMRPPPPSELDLDSLDTSLHEENIWRVRVKVRFFYTLTLSSLIHLCRRKANPI
jgi:hypothetical protein